MTMYLCLYTDFSLQLPFRPLSLGNELVTLHILSLLQGLAIRQFAYRLTCALCVCLSCLVRAYRHLCFSLVHVSLTLRTTDGRSVFGITDSGGV